MDIMEFGFTGMSIGRLRGFLRVVTETLNDEGCRLMRTEFTLLLCAPIVGERGQVVNGDKGRKFREFNEKPVQEK